MALHDLDQNIWICFYPLLKGCLRNFIEMGFVLFERKYFKNGEWPLTKVTKWPWPLEFHRRWIWMHFHIRGLNSNRKMHFFRFFFSLSKSLRPNLSLQLNSSIRVHQLYTLHSPRVPDATQEVTRQSAHWKWRRRFLIFLTYISMVAMMVMWSRHNLWIFFPYSRSRKT